MPAPAAPVEPTDLDEDQVPREIVARYKLSSATLKTLATVPSKPDRRAVLEKVCAATEFHSFPIKQAEKGFFREINENTPIPYLIGETVTQPWHKVFLLVQADLLKARWPNKISAAARKDLLRESGHIHGILDRILRCVIDILGHRRHGRGVSVALDVLRSVKAGVWEGMGTELMQVKAIGAARMDKLTDAGVRNIRQLTTMEGYHIERLLSQNPPFGHNILRQLVGFPLLRLRIDVFSPVEGTLPPENSWVVRIQPGYDNKDVPLWQQKHPWTTLVIEGDDDRLVWFWRGSVKRLEGGKDMVVNLQGKASEQLKVTFCCEGVVGTMIRETFHL